MCFEQDNSLQIHWTVGGIERAMLFQYKSICIKALILDFRFGILMIEVIIVKLKKAFRSNRILFCRKCGLQLDDDSVFCKRCGTEINRCICKNCGYELDFDSIYCKKCGTKVND